MISVVLGFHLVCHDGHFSSPLPWFFVCLVLVGLFLVGFRG